MLSVAGPKLAVSLAAGRRAWQTSDTGFAGEPPVHSRIAPVLLLVALLTTTTPAASEEAPPRQELTSREAAWFLGSRFVSAGLYIFAGEVAPTELWTSFGLLAHATGVSFQPYPAAIGSSSRTGALFVQYFRSSRPRIAAQLTQRFDAAHGALFRLGMNADMLIAGYEPAAPITRETLSDMRAAMPVARLPARLIDPVKRRMHARESKARVTEALMEFKAEVRFELGNEVGTLLADSLAGTSPPGERAVWLLGGLAAHAFVYHVLGDAEAKAATDAKLAQVAKELDVSAPAFPARKPADLASTAREAYDYLLKTWARPIADKWDYDYSGLYRALLSVPLEGIRLRFDYAPGAARVKEVSRTIARGARYAGLPAELVKPFTDLLDRGATHEAVIAGLTRLLQGVEGYLREQEEREAAGR